MVSGGRLRPGGGHVVSGRPPNPPAAPARPRGAWGQCRAVPKEAFRDSGKWPIRLTWSGSTASRFISSAGSPAGKFNNRRRQSNARYSGSLPRRSPPRFPTTTSTAK